MKLLKKTVINGEIYEEYAFLSYEFVFENKGDNTIIADFAFEIPKGASISGMRIGTSDGRLINTTVTAVSLLAQTFDGRCLLSLKEQPQSKERVFIDVYTSLPGINDEQSLIIPISGSAQISLVINSRAEAFSPTHTICEATGGLRKITAEADRDFCLKLLNAPRVNSALAVRHDFGGELLCKFYPSPSFYKACTEKIKKLLFIYDATGSLRGGAVGASREAVLAMAESFGKEYVLIAAKDAPTFEIRGEFEPLADKLIEVLAAEPKFGGSLSECFELASKYADAETLPVLICGDRLLEGEYAARAAVRCFKDRGLCVLTFGSGKASAYIESAAKQCGGSCESVFGMDNVKKCAADILKSFILRTTSAISVKCNTAKTAVVGNPLSVYDGVSVYASYETETEPRSFVLQNGDCREEFVLDKIPVFASFAPIKLALAAALAEAAQQKAELCDSDEIIELKKYIEDIGVRYSLLNSETALIAESETGGKAIRVSIENKRNDFDTFAGRESMFKETALSDEKEKLKRIALCKALIIKSVRADGAICANGELVRDIRMRQTLICMLALVAARSLDEYKGIINAAKNYIGEFSFDGISFTTDAKMAASMLKSINFGKGCDTPTDILSAALMLADLS